MISGVGRVKQKIVISKSAVGKVKFSKIALKHGDTTQYMTPPFARIKLKAIEYVI